MKRLFTDAIVVTRARFDSNLEMQPTHVMWRGREVALEQTSQKCLYSFQNDGRYYWMKRSGRDWQIVTNSESLAIKRLSLRQAALGLAA